nr:glycoside hydrolase family 76 protein [uncultured Bacteroides sp.]
MYNNYQIHNSCLLRETYPIDINYSADYLVSEESNNTPNKYSYLWPYSGTFTAVNTIFEASDFSQVYKKTLEKRVLPGLEKYLDTKRNPTAYSSYITSDSKSDRFYDDNIWIGIDFLDIYFLTHENKYLSKAKMIWNFIQSGTDEKLGGGIYWCEQKKESKNTCSNAPGAVYALKLFQATDDSTFLMQGKKLYEWTKKNLQDTEDYLYFDNINLDKIIGKAKFAYNSGQMMQAASILYKLTKNSEYLFDAQNIAKGCSNFFFTKFVTPSGEKIKLVKKGDVWFSAVMLRGFIELYNIDKNRIYLDDFDKSLDYAWQHAREKNGLFNSDFSGEKKDEKKWLLTQAAMVEMFSRIAVVFKNE